MTDYKHKLYNLKQRHKIKREITDYLMILHYLVDTSRTTCFGEIKTNYNIVLKTIVHIFIVSNNKKVFVHFKRFLHKYVKNKLVISKRISS